MAVSKPLMKGITLTAIGGALKCFSEVFKIEGEYAACQILLRKKIEPWNQGWQQQKLSAKCQVGCLRAGDRIGS